MADRGLTKWLVYSDAGWAPAVATAEILRDDDTPVPLEYVDFLANPSGFVTVEHHHRVEDEGKRLCLHIKLQPDLLRDNRHFYNEIWSMESGEITLTIIAKTTDLERDGERELQSDFVVDITPPNGLMSWFDERNPTVRMPDPIEVTADGEEELPLGVRCSLWLPQGPESARTAPTMLDPHAVAHPVQGPTYDDRGHYGFDSTVAEYSHMTGKLFDAQVFGPSDDSRPWVIAQPGMNEPRLASKWRSRAALPDPTNWPAHVPPVEDTIHVKAWVNGHVTMRGIEVLSASSEALAEALVPVKLVGAELVVELVEPREPVPADGNTHTLRFEVKNARTGKAATGPIEVELAGGSGPGGSVTAPPELTDDDAGILEVDYTPPALDFARNADYRQPFEFYRTGSEGRTLINPVDVFVNPRLDVQIAAMKSPALDFENAPEAKTVERVFDAGTTPWKLSGVAQLLETDPRIPGRGETRLAVNDASLGFVQRQGGTEAPLEGDVPAFSDRDDGTFELLLDELKDGWRLDDDRVDRASAEITLDPEADGPRVGFDQRVEDLLEEIGHWMDFAPGEDLFSGPKRVVSSATVDSLHRQREQFEDLIAACANHDSARAVQGLLLLETSLQGTAEFHEFSAEVVSLIMVALDKAMWEVIAFLISALKVFDGVLKALAGAGRAVGGVLSSLIAQSGIGPTLAGLTSLMPGLPSLSLPTTITVPALQGFIASVGPWVRTFFDALANLVTTSLPYKQVGSKLFSHYLKQFGKYLEDAFVTRTAAGAAAKEEMQRAIVELSERDVVIADAIAHVDGRVDALTNPLRGNNVVADYLTAIRELDSIEAEDARDLEIIEKISKVIGYILLLLVLFLAAVAVAAMILIPNPGPILAGTGAGTFAGAFSSLSAANRARYVVGMIAYLEQARDLSNALATMIERYGQLTKGLTP